MINTKRNMKIEKNFNLKQIFKIILFKLLVSSFNMQTFLEYKLPIHNSISNSTNSEKMNARKLSLH